MQAIANGDRAAFTTLLERHVHRVHHFVLRSTNAPADAEDLVQEVFLRVWNNARSFAADRANFSTWLIRIARNLCIDTYRRHNARPSGHNVSDSQDHIETLAAHTEPAGADLQHQRDLQALREAISNLPERQRTALTLCQLQGYSNADAAVILDVKTAAVESLLARARRSLKNTLVTQQNSPAGTRDQ